MARFDLSTYQDVQSRIKVLHTEHPDARLVTENLTTPADRSVSTWVVRASLYLTAGDQAAGLPKATGHAFEIDGGTGANATAALENAETSALGRCLRIAGIGDGPSKQEMAKANRGVTPKPTKDFIAEAKKVMNVSDLRNLYTEAAAAGASSEVLDRLKDYGKVLSASSEGVGTGAGVSSSAKSRQK